MVVMSIEQYSNLKDALEMKLDEADHQAKSSERLTHDEIFNKLRGRTNG